MDSATHAPTLALGPDPEYHREMFDFIDLCIGVLAAYRIIQRKRRAATTT